MGSGQPLKVVTPSGCNNISCSKDMNFLRRSDQVGIYSVTQVQERLVTKNSIVGRGQGQISLRDHQKYEHHF